jgi:REP element-mobilizing transposase RayT
MARKPRLYVSGGLYHVMVRGNGGQEIFFDEADRAHLVVLLQQSIECYGHRVHGFCCMPKHIHMVMPVQDIPLNQFRQILSFRDTRWLNTQQARRRHLFQGRYASAEKIH